MIQKFFNPEYCQHNEERSPDKEQCCNQAQNLSKNLYSPVSSSLLVGVGFSKTSTLIGRTSLLLFKRRRGKGMVPICVRLPSAVGLTAKCGRRD
eukprot:TRINITY_DN4661_c0_g3_i2.p1 TRINITY_DN4661_c0_g3~~TRINITY_DN4661_c0_g3_i2.p1  ORF type:complete len:101 (+),score=13.55 TRINITY_DN4661_c0_g3_i2:23-304(+)